VRPSAVSVLATFAVAASLVVIPGGAAFAAGPVTQVVGPESLLDGSAGLRLTKEYETVAPAVPGFRSPADVEYVSGPTDSSSTAAHGGSSLSLFTGAGKPNPGTNPAVALATLQGKEYVGRWFDAGTAASRLSSFSYRSMGTVAGLAPYLSVELYDAAAPAGQRYVNLVWAPGIHGNPAVTPGVWQDFDTTTGWSTSASFVSGITANATISLTDAMTAISADDHPLPLLRANVSWGDTGGGYASTTAYLDDITMTLDGTATTYSFDAPTSTCAAPTGGWIGASELADPAQWSVHTEYQPSVVSTATASVATGPAGASGGASLVLASGAGTDVPGMRGYAGKVFVDKVLPGCTVGDLNDLSYRSFTANGQSGLAPYLNIDVSLPGVPTGPGQTSILVWSPGDGGAPAPAVNDWTTFTPGTSPGWRTIRPLGTLVTGTHYTWAQVQAAIPNALMPRGVELVVGDSTYQSTPGAGWSNKTLQVDTLSLQIGTQTSAFDFGGPVALCASTIDYVGRLITLTADCSTDRTIYVPDGWTLDGNGHSIIAMETSTTAFTGAIVQNAGVLMDIRELTVTTNKAVWDDATKNSGGDLVGVRFLAASGSLYHVTVDGVSHGNGVQEGKGVLVDNRTGTHSVQVSITGSTIVNYQKNGVDVRGDGATLELRDSTVGRAGSPLGAVIDTRTAANSVVVAYGANAVIAGNHITGNDWDGTNDVSASRDWNATAVLLYQAAGAVVERNVIDGAGTDTGIDSTQSAAAITCNLVIRTADQPGRLDVWSRGIWVDGGATSLAGNTVTNFRTPITGAVNAAGGGCAPGLPTITVSVETPHSAWLIWGPGTVLPYAPVTSYEVSVDGVVTTVDGADTAHHITGMVPGSTHRVALREINADGPGPWASAPFTTYTIPVPAPVSGLTASMISRTGAVISWASDATFGDGAVHEYEMSVAPLGTVAVGPAATVGRALSGLAPGTTYTVTLRAHNESGWSNPVSVLFTTNDLDRRTPGAPTLAVGSPVLDGALPVSWTANAADSTDFPVLHWIVTVDGTDEAFLPVGTATYSVTGLATGRHTISVRGINDLGGAAFAAQVVVIPSASPAPPVRTATLAATPALLVAGSTSTLRGSFLTDSTPAADAVVTLWAQSGASWISVGTTVTAADGSYAFTVAPTRTTRYRAITSGMPSAYTTVTVRPKVTAKVTTKKVRGVLHAILTITVSPKLARTAVRLQRLSGTTWVMIGRGVLSPASTAVFDLGRVGGKVSSLRVLVAATSVTSATNTARIIVRAPGR